MNKLEVIKELLAKEAHGMTVGEAIAAGICIQCKNPPTFYSDAGKREYRITALCEPCYDAIAQAFDNS